uniref:Putative secreted protein n=1 Tax=Anopheles darlingi TaxID=43151 RepID=A0A2M4D3P9_ANODA
MICFLSSLFILHACIPCVCAFLRMFLASICPSYLTDRFDFTFELPLATIRSIERKKKDPFHYMNRIVYHSPTPKATKHTPTIAHISRRLELRIIVPSIASSIASPSRLHLTSRKFNHITLTERTLMESIRLLIPIAIPHHKPDQKRPPVKRYTPPRTEGRANDHHYCLFAFLTLIIPAASPAVRFG